MLVVFSQYKLLGLAQRASGNGLSCLCLILTHLKIFLILFISLFFPVEQKFIECLNIQSYCARQHHIMGRPMSDTDMATRSLY